MCLVSMRMFSFRNQNNLEQKGPEIMGFNPSFFEEEKTGAPNGLRTLQGP